MSRAPLYKTAVKMLGDLASSRALERVLHDAANARGTDLDSLDAHTLEQILKNDVYKRLQHTVPAPLAKRRVMEVLKELEKMPDVPPATRALLESQVNALEEGSRKFTLYFDWPEAQRLRGVLGLARTEEAAGRPVDALVYEGQELIGQMERKLEEGLVAQAQDLAEFKAAFTRVSGVGGRDVRRLESLIAQIDEAQEQRTLLPGEVERARNISFKLRKSMESSVVQGVETSAALAPNAQARVQALEQEHAGRQLNDQSREFAALFRVRPDLQEQNEQLRGRHNNGQLAVEEVGAWRTTLVQARDVTLAEQSSELASLENQLAALPGGTAGSDVQLALDVARMALSSGSLATDELMELRISINALNRSPVEANRILEQQRELAEIERSARDVPGAENSLREALAEARDTLARGREIGLSSLWATLEQHMGQAAQQRESLDARADHVVQEYDKVRSLAGETTQRLGRLADTLRSQRRLGPMSAQARERYAQTLTDAEALLAEARAEYQAAQEVTSSFGSDALSGLLDVFDFGESDVMGGNNSGESGLFGLGDAPAPGASSGGSDLNLMMASLLSGSASKELSGEIEAPPVYTPPAHPREANETDWGRFNTGQVDRWNVVDGRVVDGTQDDHLTKVAGLLGQADHLGLQRLDMADALHVWSARLISPGVWRLARGRDWDGLEKVAGQWLDSGSDTLPA
ncbi:hypothetical protein [Deinococcus sp.]|uniref:hypothetical protein n=1 Tax=Deinococcus sp. TaxID=47478 RepID=UPI0025C11215|nr:hypothetical protein [Deinococcus sp.]